MSDDINIEGFGELHQIGRGGFATVYRARDLRLGRQVAIKVLADSQIEDDRLGRFRREAAAMADLSWHPNIAAVHSFGSLDDERPYLVMEYLQAGSFADRLRKDGPMDPAEVLPIAQQLADALVAVHGSGIVHRDLKPSNVLIGRRGEAKLADFGIAGISGGDRTTVGTFVGTALHSAPEVMQGEMATPASDLWSLASTLFTMINGRAPFSDPEGDHNPVAMLYRAANNPMPGFRSAPPEPLADGIRRCLMVDPRDRPASAEDLSAILAGRSTPRSQHERAGGERVVGPSALASDRGRSDDVMPNDRIQPSIQDPDESGARQVRRPSGGTEPVPVVKPGGPPRPVAPEQVQAPPVAREPATPRTPTPVAASASARVERPSAPAGRQRPNAPDRASTATPSSRPPVAEPARPPTPTYWRGMAFVAVLLLAVAAYVLFRLLSGGGDDPVAGEQATQESTAVAEESSAEVDARPDPPEGFVRYDGRLFSADVPAGWVATSEDADQGYGFRTRWEAPNGDFVFVDANKTKGGIADPERSAREISSGMGASRILVEAREEEELSEIGDLAWSFEFTALRNVEERRIDIFSSESGHGYAVVAGSVDDPDAAFEVARQLVRSYRTNLE